MLSDDQITQIRARLLQQAIADRDANPWRYYRFERDDLQKWIDKVAVERDAAKKDAADLLALVDQLRSERDAAIARVWGGSPPAGYTLKQLAEMSRLRGHTITELEASLARLRTALEGLPAWLNRLATEMDQVEDTANLFMQELSGLRVWADKIEAALASTRPDAER